MGVGITLSFYITCTDGSSHILTKLKLCACKNWEYNDRGGE